VRVDVCTGKLCASERVRAHACVRACEYLRMDHRRGHQGVRVNVARECLRVNAYKRRRRIHVYKEEEDTRVSV